MSILAACGSDDGDTASPSGSTSGVATSTTVVDVSTDGMDPDKVILASILLAVGGVDIALADGLVTAEEVDLAAAALEDGSLDEWVDQARIVD